jgi:hypothetical protein
MKRGKVFGPTVLAASVLAVVVVVGAGAAGGFVEQDVQVLHEFSGPAKSASYGWAGSPLRDVDRDGADELIVGEPFTDTGSAYVYSGRTGSLLYRVDGAAGDWTGFSMADAGDTNGDGTHDFLVGSPGNGSGHADLYSGRSGALLHRFAAGSDGDSFGWAVSSAGDVDRDGRPDVLIGASGYASGTGPGFAYLYSGRTYELIRTLAGSRDRDQFGSGVGWTRDVDRDGVADQIIGARNAGEGRRGTVSVYSGRTGTMLYTIDATPQGGQFGSFFVSGAGDVNRDGTPDIYAADYADTTNGVDAAENPAGRAAVYSGADGRELLSWLGEPGDGLGPGRSAGDVDRDGHPDLIVGSYTSSAGALDAGKATVFSGKNGSVLRTITSTAVHDELGFDAVGIGDVNRDGILDALVTAANGDRVFVVAGTRPHHD